MGATIGLVPITEQTTSLYGLMSNADLACYAAKEQGRNRLHIYTNSYSDINRRWGKLGGCLASRMP